MDERNSGSENAVTVYNVKRKNRLPYTQFGRRFLYKENPALDAGFRERYAFDQKSSKS